MTRYALLLISLILTACGGGFQTFENVENDSKAEAPEKHVDSPQDPVPSVPQMRSLTVVFVNSSTGQRIPNATIHVKSSSRTFQVSQSADSQGQARFLILQDQYIVTATISSLSVSSVVLLNEDQNLQLNLKPYQPPIPKGDAETFQLRRWFTSNMGALDLLDMLRDDSRWPMARRNLDVFKFYSGQLLIDNPEHCLICGPNLRSSIYPTGGLRRLQDWNIKIASEHGSVKPGDCDAAIGTRSAIELFQRVKEQGAAIRFLSMDEPFVSAKEWCHISPAQAAAHVANFSRNVEAGFRATHPDLPFGIGWIEAYPYHSMEEILNFFELLRAQGYTPAFFHLDVDRIAMGHKKISSGRFLEDLRRLQEYVNRINIPLGVLFWGQEGNDSRRYRDNVLGWVDQFKSLYGTPDHVIFQAWEATSNDPNRKIIPYNLDETDPVSHTGILLEGLTRFGLNR